MTKGAATVVLVHGAWHGAWCWDAVRARLDAAGVPTVVVDNPSVARAPSTLHDDADNVRLALDAISGPVVLVGHSYGGAIVTDAGVHDAVRHVVYVSAFALDHGESVVTNDLTGGEAGSVLEQWLRFEDDLIFIDPAEAAIDAFFHDCEPAIARAAVSQLRPQSIAAMGGVPRAVAWRDRPSTYVLCTDDRAVAPALQRSAAARTKHVIELPSSHSPFLSRPGEIADLLGELAQ